MYTYIICLCVYIYIHIYIYIYTYIHIYIYIYIYIRIWVTHIYLSPQESLGIPNYAAVFAVRMRTTRNFSAKLFLQYSANANTRYFSGNLRSAETIGREESIARMFMFIYCTSIYLYLFFYPVCPHIQ